MKHLLANAFYLKQVTPTKARNAPDNILELASFLVSRHQKGLDFTTSLEKIAHFALFGIQRNIADKNLQRKVKQGHQRRGMRLRHIFFSEILLMDTARFAWTSNRSPTITHLVTTFRALVIPSFP
jgi:hypothetical protein